MKNKKIWARIGAILACVLLVGVLAVPCFADEVQIVADEVQVPAPPPNGYTPPYGSAVDEFTASLDPRANNRSYTSLIDYYRGYGDSRFFDIKTLVVGLMDVMNNADYTVTLPNFVTNSSSDSTVNFSVDLYCDYANFSLYTTDLTPNPVLSDYYNSGRFNFLFYFSGDSVMLDLYYYTHNPLPEFGFRFNGTSSDQIILSLTSFFYTTQSYTPADIYRFELAVAVSNDDNGLAIPFLSELFYSVAPYYYSQKVYSPYDFYQGFKKSYNLGYADAERYAYQYGFTDGYDEGYNMGYEEGIRIGGSYELGYNDAVKDIDSGEFGQNLLGEAFSAPINALSRFTLVRLPNGLAITAANLISAVIALTLVMAFFRIYGGLR